MVILLDSNSGSDSDDDSDYSVGPVEYARIFAPFIAQKLWAIAT